MALRAAETDEDALSDERGINNLGRVFNGADVFTGVFNGADVFNEVVRLPDRHGIILRRCGCCYRTPGVPGETQRA
jgi:hypothetical protein